MRFRQHKVSQRQECQQRHVVCNQHGADEGDDNQRHGCGAEIGEAAYNAARQTGEEADAAQCHNDGEHTEQAGQRLEIEIGQVFRIRRNKDGGDAGGGKRDAEYGVFAHEFAECGKQLLRKRMMIRAARFSGQNVIGHGV